MTGRRSRFLAAAALVGVTAFPFIGRAVLSSDGLEVVGEALGLLVNGTFSFARMPAASGDPMATAAAFHSAYGVYPSLVSLVFLAPVWPFRLALGAPALDALVALTWWGGTFAAALSFLALARRISAGVSGLWASAFVAATFLWPYASDSFFEPYAAAAIAFAASLILRTPSRPVAAAALWAAACLLKPLLWVTAPVAVLALALGKKGAVRDATLMIVTFVAALASQFVVNFLRTGSFLETGYGDVVLRFTSPLLHGLWGILISPGRGLLLYAPLCLAAFLAFPRLTVSARVLCFVTPLVQILVVARWWTWEGGSCWGPRYLLPILPLLAAPAVLAPKWIRRAAVALGVGVNVAGVVVSAGSWIAYAESLRPPAEASWPAGGTIRVSEVPALSPVTGHWVLVLRNVFGRDVSPALPSGTAEREPLPDAAQSVSPWLLRRALALPRLRPMIPRILVRSAAGYLLRGRAREALALARAARELDPSDGDAARLAADAEALLRRSSPP